METGLVDEARGSWSPLRWRVRCAAFVAVEELAGVAVAVAVAVPAPCDTISCSFIPGSVVDESDSEPPESEEAEDAEDEGGDVVRGRYGPSTISLRRLGWSAPKDISICLAQREELEWGFLRRERW